MLVISYKISLKGLIYYFYHLTTLKHLEDLNMMFLDYLILLLYIGYTILRMEHNCKKYYFILILYKNESNATILILNTIQNVDVIYVISLFSQKFVYFLQETRVNIYVLFLFRKKKKIYLVILSDHFYIKFM